jgi:hypothetical protein
MNISNACLIVYLSVGYEDDEVHFLLYRMCIRLNLFIRSELLLKSRLYIVIIELLHLTCLTLQEVLPWHAWTFKSADDSVRFQQKLGTDKVAPTIK